MKHYIVNGRPRSGKDTFVDEVIRLGREEDLLVGKISTIDFIKEAALMLGWNGLKDNKGRKFLSDLKDISTLNYNQPFKVIQKEINRYSGYSFFIFIREPEEIQKLTNAYPSGTFMTVCVVGGLSESTQSNHADENVFNFDYDYVIENCGTIDHLNEFARYFYDTIVRRNFTKAA